MRTVLLNPPGRRIYVRDYYCSKTAKADYTYSPVDLLLLSGRFPEAVLIDAVRDRLSPAQCLDLLEKEDPKAVVSLVGAVSWPEDREFLARVKERLPQARILASGDVLLEAGARLMAQEKWLDGIILDFTNNDAVLFLQGETEKISQMICRDQEGLVVERTSPRASGTITDLPLPRHSLFLAKRYAYPFVRSARFATVQTDYGCPFSCRFCVMARLGYRVRPLGEVIQELEHLRDSGVREIYFNDQTFGADKKRLEALCKAMIDRGLGLGWCCWSRVDLVPGHLELMKTAGCHTIMFGVETAHQETLERLCKGFGPDRVRRTFALCRKLGLRTLGTYLIGLPGETEEMIEETIRFALELDSDFASFNVLVPRKGTDLRAALAASGIEFDDGQVLDQTGESVVSLGQGGLAPERIKALRDKAVRAYYGRPGYMLKRLAKVRTWYDLRTLVRSATTLSW